MRGRLYPSALIALVLPLLGGCVQMTRHSNMMIFGTNTVVGVRAGVNATSIPEVAIGYARQEAVVLPLVANVVSVPSKTTTVTTRQADGSIVTNTVVENGSANRLDPCNLQGATPGAAPPAGYPVHPCSLVGINGKALDSYSVLASFGGNFRATGDTTKPEAAAGVAQYFATGIAAQTLALNGGAAVVAAGPTATEASKRTPALATTDATPEQIALARTITDSYGLARKLLVADIRASAHPVREIIRFEGTIQSTANISGKCTTAQTCIDIIEEGDPYYPQFRQDPKTFNNALAAWQTN